MVSEKEREIASFGNTPERERERKAGRQADRERQREMVVVEKLQSEAAQWLERRTRDRKVQGSSTHRSGGRIFFARVKHLC